MGTDLRASSRAWQESVEQTASRLRTDPHSGLTSAEAAARLARYGPNAIAEGGRRSALAIIADQFKDFSIMVLLAAALVAGVVGDLKDTIAIAVIVALNAAIAATQELRAQRAILALRQLASDRAMVVRDGAQQAVAAADLVPGDLVVLEAGSKVPADIRLTHAVQLRIAEAALTGESVPVDKSDHRLDAEDLPVADRTDIAFSGTAVSNGRGRGIVIATGSETEIGKIARLIETKGEGQTPLQQRLAEFARKLGVIVIGVCAVILAVGLARGEPVGIMVLTAVSLAVAAIPEALPATIAISLALGARKMAAHNALIRRLPAVEALGSVTFICSDKTGTLTQDRMHVDAVCAADGAPRTEAEPAGAEPWRSLYRVLALNNDVVRRPDGEEIGDATEIAGAWFAAEAGYLTSELEASAPRVLELPFDSGRKRMTTVHAEESEFVAYCKGAPETVIHLCSRALARSGEMPLDREAAIRTARAMARQGLRVLALAERRLASLPMEESEIEREMTFVGLVGFIDPPRPEAAEAVAACRAAGITPVMITGDHPDTAQAIALRLGIMVDGDEVVSGSELARMPDEELSRRIARIRVYARVDPEQKIRIVEALQAKGEFVAMTGDGVNDAPALQRANVGVAMGRSGTDVAREAASLVLIDDNFATIVAAVREGRRIYDNVRKLVRFLLTGNSAEIWTIFLAPFLGLPVPLLPIHILWINLVTDGLPALALAAEPAEGNVMARPPRAPEEGILARGLWQHAVWVGLLIAAVCLIVQAFGVHSGIAHWQTMVFTVLTLSQLAHVLAIRSERASFFSRDSKSNPALYGAVGLTVLLQLAVVYAPPLNEVFNTAPLTSAELGACLALSAVPFVAVELEKALRRRGVLRDWAKAG